MAFDPSTTHPLYERLAPGWRANQDFAEMLPHVLREGIYLDEFGGPAGEAPAQFDLRRRMSVALDLCEDLLNLRLDNLFRVAPVRSYAQSPYAAHIGRFLSDVDGGGTDMTSFMRSAVRKMYVNGVDIVVDKNAPDDSAHGGPQAATDLRPVLQAFTPLERLDWACDHSGQYLWVRYDLGEQPADDEQAQPPQLRRYLTLTREGWRVHRVGRGPGGRPGGLETSAGVHSVAVCPVVSFYFRESSRPDYPRVPLSLLTRLTPIARWMLNLVSQGQLDLYLTVAFFVATGVNPEDIPDEMGAATCWALPNPEAKIHHAMLGCEHIAEKRRWLELATEAMLRIGGLTGAAGELGGRAASGVQVAVERTDLDNEMRSTAVQAEQVEQRLVQLAISRQCPPPGGGLIPPDRLGLSVEYNKEYVLTPATELVRQVREMVDAGVDVRTPGLLRLQLRKLLSALGKAGDSDHDQALREIHALGEPPR